jgi:ATP-dependent DNA helicase RecG
MIRFLKYQGEVAETGEKRNVVKDIAIEGRIPDIIAEADSVIRSQAREFSALGKDGKFYNEPEYPEAAWYEAVVNACVHRSYSMKGMNIFIRMFDNRLEIESPGGFMPFVTPETIYETHVRRNYWLMDAMYYMDFVKCENEGAKRMRSAMLESGLPAPQFEEKRITGYSVRVTLRNSVRSRTVWIDKDATDILGEQALAGLDQECRRIVNFVARYEKINVTQAARLTGRRWHAAKKLLASLAEREILTHVSRFSRHSGSHFVLRGKAKRQE